MLQREKIVIYVQPILAHFSISFPPENVRKAKVFWRFQGV